ncbi:hypothetical protein VTJ04DRAFT_6046 [Mycothermus thermophilus]|uniref:uncharacterized protein n=1 Tax=Humicola insolens TaxID=85995 RepID=UPI003742AAF7
MRTWVTVDQPSPVPRIPLIPMTLAFPRPRSFINTTGNNKIHCQEVNAARITRCSEMMMDGAARQNGRQSEPHGGSWETFFGHHQRPSPCLGNGLGA